jgi:pimeloyl-ACP methyl ester carboxylesterase
LSFELRREELPAFWEAIECPVLLLAGDESVTRSRQHPNPADHFRDVRTAVIEGAGHWMHHDQPEQVLAAAQEFFDQTAVDG